MKKGTHFILNNNYEILLNDEKDITLSIISNGKTIYSVLVEPPSGGYGGGFLLPSPSEQYLVFSFYSGESEEAYQLFKINDCILESIFECDYLCGEGASYIFSDNEAVLIQALPESVGPWFTDDAMTDENEHPFFVYGKINILDIQKKTMHKHTLTVYPSDSWDNDMAEAEPFFISKVPEGHALHLIMPWGEEVLSLPLNDTIIFRPE